MSRVFEALTKANEDKRQQTEKGSEPAQGDFFRPGANAVDQPSVDWPVPGDGPFGYGSEIALAATANGHKSWRERIEELFFGWDLARYNSYPIVALDKESPASEQYKIFREQIKRLRTEGGIHAFSITSPVKKDGKTTIAVNLAAALALDYEEKVLLIDGDFRAPAVHRYFNAPQSPGLADYLASKSRKDLKGLIQDTFLPGLRILPAGKPAHLFSELLAREKMKQAMEEIRSEFPAHQIIIDSPPILSTPDPLVIAGHVDGVLLVMRAGKTPRDYLKKALQSLNSKKVMGVVLNGAELGMASKYYYYYSAKGAD